MAWVLVEIEFKGKELFFELKDKIFNLTQENPKIKVFKTMKKQ